MVALDANYRLKTWRQETRIAQWQLFRTDGAGEQVWEDSRQTQHPDFEIARRELDRTSLFERSHGHSNKPEDRILRFVLRQKSIQKLDEMAGANGPVVIFKKLHRRIQQVRG